MHLRVRAPNRSDTLSGGVGDDTLFGNEGNDVFVWDADSAAGNDRVRDLRGGDSLWFRGMVPTHLSAEDDPSGLLVGQAMVGTPSDGVTMLYVRLDDSDTGLTSITLDGILASRVSTSTPAAPAASRPCTMKSSRATHMASTSRAVPATTR